MLHNESSSNDPIHLLKALEATQLFAASTVQWHMQSDPNADENSTLLALHQANYRLWHLEDSARDTRATDATVAATKRSIDKVNQQRNDLVERLDTELLQALAAAALPDMAAPLHSETPGLILDRLSILALKIFHTAEEAARTDADAQHSERNRQRLAVLLQQNNDLTGCLAELWREVCEGKRSYRLYRQMKMYNDPELNPVLYTAHAASARAGA